MMSFFVVLLLRKLERGGRLTDDFYQVQMMTFIIGIYPVVTTLTNCAKS